MDKAKLRRRSVYVSYTQKKKLIEFVANHPELIACKVTPDFSYEDSRKLWQNITVECNALPGARKSWRQWRKTWQDLRSKTKKRNKVDGVIPVMTLSEEEQVALGIKNISRNSDSYQEDTEFVTLNQDPHPQDDIDVIDNLHMEMEASMSEPESPPEVKVFTRKTKLKNNSKHNSSSSQHSNNCVFNCDLLAVHEKRKLELKEDYINFKKDYLRQKLKILKEQTEALKLIAKELNDK